MKPEKMKKIRYTQSPHGTYVCVNDLCEYLLDANLILGTSLFPRRMFSYAFNGSLPAYVLPPDVDSGRFVVFANRFVIEGAMRKCSTKKEYKAMAAIGFVPWVEYDAWEESMRGEPYTDVHKRLSPLLMKVEIKVV